MKYVAAFISFQGLSYFINSVEKLYTHEAFKLGTKMFSFNLWYLGVILGFLLVISGIGIMKKKDLLII